MIRYCPNKTSVSLASIKNWWRWGESNPRPKENPHKFLRAQFVL